MKPELDPALLVSFNGPKHHFLLVDSPLDERRQCDPVIERIRLVTEQGDNAVWVSFSKRLRGSGACDAVSNDDVLSVSLSQTDPGLDGGTAPQLALPALSTPPWFPYLPS